MGKPEVRTLERPSVYKRMILRKSYRINIGYYGLDSFESAEGPVLGSCEDGHEVLESIKRT